MSIDGESTSRTDQDKSSETVWGALDSWSSRLETWQQEIIRRCVAAGSLTSDEIDDVYALFLRQRGLEESGNDTSAVQYSPAAGRPSSSLGVSVELVKVDQLVGINALPEGSELTFGPELTVIYGANGTGKSGFARLIANACFSRRTPDILGDVNADDPPHPSAVFHVTSDKGQSIRSIGFPDECDGSPLKSFSVFDSKVAEHHLTEAAAFEFRPAGFDVFREMARVYGAMQERLDHEIEEKTRENTFLSAFLGDGTEVHDLVSALSEDTDIAKVRALGKYGSDEAARVADLDKQILALKAKSPKAILAELREARSDIEALGASLVKVGATFSEESFSRRKHEIVEAKRTAEAATLIGSEQFKRPFFKAVGSTEWSSFLTSFHALAAEEGSKYPNEEDRCLLCERPLDDASREHLQNLLRFVEGDARKAAASAAALVARELEEIRSLDLGVFSNTSRVRSHVQRLAPEVAKTLDQIFDALHASSHASQSDLMHYSDTAGSVDVRDCVGQTKEIKGKLDADILRLESESTDEALMSLENERRTLRHREVLSQQLTAIEKFVGDAMWASHAKKARSALNTRHITDKEKELFSIIVGEGYRRRLGEECDTLGCSVPVEMRTKGKRGETVHSLSLSSGHQPVEVLSEGEQKVVAIADFLTEVSLNPNSAGVIFDDPVSSVDHERKARIAVRLAREAQVRQVIVLTHDMVFLHQICEAGAKSNVDLLGHWVQRDAHGRPGSVAIGDLPDTAKAYETTKKAEEALAEAKAATGQKRATAIKTGMGSLRTTMEVMVVQRVFKDIVSRWRENVRVTALRRVKWDDAKIEEICELYEDLSRYIEGHTHSDEATGAPPEPEKLDECINQVKDLIKWAKADR